MSIQLLHVHSGAIGYGRLGVALAGALGELGVEVLDELDQETHRAAQIACWVSTPAHASGWWKGQHASLFTMWEASRLPESFREHLHEFETVVVPSKQNLELFSQYHDNVRYVPLGIDSHDWRFRARQPVEDEFRFLIGGSGARKGVDLAHKAFLTLWGKEGSWGSGPVPKLTMKSPKGGDFFGPRITVVGGKLDADEEIALYAQAHCYLQPSRGEGFGLQPLQAIAQGCPTILTDAHGHAAFAHLGYGIGYTMAPSDYFIFGDAGDWWEPNFDELVDKMRYVYDNYDDAQMKARASSAQAHVRFTWNKTATKFLDCFDRSLLRDYDGPWEWFTPEAKMYRVRVLNARQMEIAGTRYAMVPDEDYWVPADVKRILFESNGLDPDCLDDKDPGLTEAQLAKRGLYAAQHAFCPTCHQQMGTKLTIDQIYEELAKT
jgi:glycosyltransferase involved in cell wall biosynthesis